MRSNVPFVVATGVFALLFAPSEADARNNFRNLVPNGNVRRCLTCHLNANGGQGWNDFGNDVRSRLRNGQPDWAAVYMLDSDGDGQTNGQELGDPCGTWLPGQPAPRMVEVSGPGDTNSTTSMPEVPDCTPDAGVVDPVDAGFEPDAGASAADSGVTSPPDSGVSTPGPSGNDEGDGGCTCLRPNTSPPWVLGFGIVLALVLRRRR